MGVPQIIQKLIRSSNSSIETHCFESTPHFRKPLNGSVSKPCTPGEHQNSWSMDVHPTKNVINRYWSIPICWSYNAWTYDKYGEREGQKTKSTCILKSIHRNVESYVAFRSDPAKFTTGRTAVLLRLDHASIEPPSHANASGWVEFSVISYDDFVLAQNRLVEDRFAYWIHH